MSVRQAHMGRMLVLSGLSEADAVKAAADVVAFETKLAEASVPRAELRDLDKLYNPVGRAGLIKLTPKLDWAGWLDAIGAGSATAISVDRPDTYKKFESLLVGTKVATLRHYLRFHSISTLAPSLAKPVFEEDFAFFQVKVTGRKVAEPRWKRCLAAVNTGVGEVAGRYWVERAFPGESKAVADAMLGDIQDAFVKGLPALAWMDDATRERAREKAGKISRKIGYPDVWRDYSAFEVKADDPVGNAQRSNRFELDRNLGKLGKPIDRSEWGMTPQTVNAYYSATMNEIVFPAAILQPPFFDMAADDATNYGGIGAVIGHEISHGFDDSGSQFDADGNLKNWWTADDRKAFEGLTARVVAQYDGYQPLPGKNIQGKLTLGENLADVSGLAVSYRAYRLSLGGKEAPVVNGITGDQRFFLGWAQVWRSQYRDAALLQQLTTDPHSPGRFRAIGSPVNMDAFHQAFGTQPGDGMWKAPDDRIRIW